MPKLPPKSCKAWHAGDGGVGRDTLLGRMTETRGTGHFGTGTYFVSSRERIGPGYEDRQLRCIPLRGSKMFRPASESAAERLFDVLRQANSSVAWGVWATEKSDDEEGYEPAELERRFSDLYGRLKSELPELTGKSQRIASILEEAADEYDACRRRRDQQACELDSASTRLMRLAGYDGIDVRGLERFDNTIHGSVVYRRKG